MTTLTHAPAQVQPCLPFADFTPTLEDEAFRSGFELVMEGEDPEAPDGWDFRRMVAFYDGVIAAWREREGRADFDSWLDARTL